jgi:hypothetical protein
MYPHTIEIETTDKTKEEDLEEECPPKILIQQISRGKCQSHLNRNDDKKEKSVAEVTPELGISREENC